MSVIKLETVRKEGEFRESLKETDWAWLSGMLDGEGHLAIRKGRAIEAKKHQGNGWSYYMPRVGASSTNYMASSKMAHMLEQNIHIRPAIADHKPVYYVEIASRTRVKEILPFVIPFLVIKKKIAEIIYQFVCLPRGSEPQKEILYQEFRKCR